MKIIAINGSPRKKGNTASLCQEFLNGALSVKEEKELEVKMIHLYELDYKGCLSCFSCKKAGMGYGICAIKDALHELLKEITQADALAFGSPIYLGSISGQMQAFFERLFFPLISYEKSYRTLAPKRMPVAMIYTMNLSKELMEKFGYKEVFAQTESFIERVLTKPEIIYAYNTYQFDNYGKYEAGAFSEKEKSEYRDKFFPQLRKKAFDCGRSFVLGASSKA